MTYRVAIPSLHRPHVLATHTLPLLLSRGISADRVDVFVTAEEHDAYAAVVGDCALHGDTPIGMAAMRNHVNDHYPTGAHVVSCDDDLRNVLRCVARHEIVPVENLDDLFREGFGLMYEGGATLWGVDRGASQFGTASASYHLQLLVGAMFGHVVDPALRLVAPAYFSHEWTLLHFLRDRSVCRLGDVGVETTTRQPGGLGDGEERRRLEVEGSNLLLALYPALLRRLRGANDPGIEFIRA